MTLSKPKTKTVTGSAVTEAPKVEAPSTKAATANTPSKKLRISLQTGSMGVMLAADLLGAKDPDNEGWDDYFAMKLRELALDMQHVAITGKLPTDGE